MDEGLILRFLTKTVTAEDSRIIDQWLVSNPENMRWLFEMEEMWGLKTELKYADKEEIRKEYLHFLERIERRESTQRKQKKRYFLYRVCAAAVAAVLLLLVSINIFQTMETENIIHNLSENIDVSEIDVPFGQKISVKLADGTKVWLNSGSKLIYPAKFSTRNRLVKLVGEGFFEVEHQKKSPFIVMSGNVNTTVLGTKFNVKGYPEENVRIALLEGIIEVSTNQGNEIVRLSEADQQVEISKEGLVTRKEVNAHAIAQWIQGEFYFDNETIENIALSLERKFDVKITIQNENYNQMLFNSRIKENASLEEILIILKGTRNIDYSISGRNVYIY